MVYVFGYVVGRRTLLAASGDAFAGLEFILVRRERLEGESGGGGKKRRYRGKKLL